MGIFFSIFLLMALAVLSVRHFRARRIVRELEAALRAERRMLVLDPAPLKRLGLEGLVGAANELIDRCQGYSDTSQSYFNQIEATLGSIQEAILIFDAEHTVEFANEAAQRLFQRGRPLRGVRLESVLRSTSLLELLEAYREGDRSPLRQVSIEARGQIFWFEASCAEVKGVSSEETVSTLLVLHDITRLKTLEVMRRDFVANVSHELRTPLTIIKGFAETLKEENATLPEETRGRFVDKIVNNARRLHFLVEDLLTLSRLESTPEQVVPVVQPIQPLVDEIAEHARSRLESSRQMLRIEVDEGIQDFAFDRFRIHQVLDNLVDNAFRYAPDFKQLVLRLRPSADGAFIECRVEDDGPGIPVKDLPHIFERFYRVDKGRSRERGGTGLGLSIMKHIVQLHGGSVWAESELGQGTAICFTLPYVMAGKAETGKAES